MKRVLVILLMLVVLSSLTLAQSSLEACDSGFNCEHGNYCAYYFYGLGCPHCENIKPVLDQLEQDYPQYTFHRLEIWTNDTNADLFVDFANRYGIERKGVPAVFIGDQALIGDSVIENNLQDALDFYLEQEPVCPLDYNKQEPTLHDISPSESIDLTIPAVIVSAFFDSINPCALGVLAVLLIYLSLIGTRKRMLKSGSIYIATVFVVYFLSGLGLFVFVQSFAISKIVLYVFAWIAIIGGVINLKDFFWYGKGFSLAIPEKGKPLIQKYVHLATTVPAIIILGILVSIFEGFCTGIVYIYILALLASSQTFMGAIPWLLLYNFIFVLPLIVMLLLVYFGMSAKSIQDWTQKHKKFMRLGLGLFMVLLGVAMLSGVFG
ncbi:MAG: hypothetical protein ABIE22_04830 [archaeon]